MGPGDRAHSSPTSRAMAPCHRPPQDPTQPWSPGVRLPRSSASSDLCSHVGPPSASLLLKPPASSERPSQPWSLILLPPTPSPLPVPPPISPYRPGFCGSAQGRAPSQGSRNLTLWWLPLLSQQRPAGGRPPQSSGLGSAFPACTLTPSCPCSSPPPSAHIHALVTQFTLSHSACRAEERRKSGIPERVGSLCPHSKGSGVKGVCPHPNWASHVLLTEAAGNLLALGTGLVPLQAPLPPRSLSRQLHHGPGDRMP